MSTRKKFAEEFLNSSAGFDAARLIVGSGLFIRGALFMAHPETLVRYTSEASSWVIPAVLLHYAVFSHVVGGIALALGFRTRFAAAAQVPAVSGALFFVHLKEGLLGSGQSLELAALVLGLLLLFVFVDCGKLSLDHWLAVGSPRISERRIRVEELPEVIADVALRPANSQGARRLSVVRPSPLRAI